MVTFISIVLLFMSVNANPWIGKSDLRNETTSKFETYPGMADGKDDLVEMVTCQRFPRSAPGSDLELMCPDGEVIHIHFAQWGRTRPEKDTMCPCNAKAKSCWTQNITNCVSSRSMGKVKSICEGKQNCRLVPMNDVFGNPCPGVAKYLQVRYSCKQKEEWALSDKGKKARDGYELTTCERFPGRLPTTDIKIQCPAGQRVHITHAFYGRKTHDTYCNHYFITKHKETSCSADNALEIVKSYCQGRHGCVVPPTNNAFGNPCQGVYKYLQVHYHCQFPTQEDKKMEAKKLSSGTEVTSCQRTRGNPPGNDLVMHCPPGHVITIQKAFYGRKVKPEEMCPCTAYCAKSANTNCTASGAETIVKKRCEGRSFCVVQPTNELFGNPCTGTLKYLQVTYGCKKSPNADASTGGVFRASMAALDHSMGRKLVEKSGVRRIRACQRQTLKITCRKNEKIQLVNATFGRLESAEKVCPPPYPDNCRNNVARHTVTTQCGGRNRCSLTSSAVKFDDLCPYTAKALEVEYSCSANARMRHRYGYGTGSRHGKTEASTKTITICGEDETKSIKCAQRQKLVIHSANYGRTTSSKKTCGFDDDICRSSDSWQVVKNTCEDKQSCDIWAHTSVFVNDPCPLTYKYLQVDYRCVSDGDLEVVEVTDSEADNPLEIDAAEEDIVETHLGIDLKPAEGSEGEEGDALVDDEDIDVDKVIIKGAEDFSVDDKIIDFFG